MILGHQDGIIAQMIHQGRFISRKLQIPSLPKRSRSKKDVFRAPESTSRERVKPLALEVRDLTVRYGAVVAVNDVSLSVEPGRILGLIGPNGAGKTTLVDAISGFVKPEGSVLLGDGDVAGWSVTRRARAGISRSFQSLELFEDLTVFDNLRAGSDPRDGLSLVRDLVWPTTPPLTPEVVAAINEFDLQDDLERLVHDLPYGQRRLLAIARAVAMGPSVLLLDEPASGLSETETRELAHLVRRLADEWGMGVLLIEHDVNFVMTICDKIVVLDFGKKISEGSPEFVRADPVVVAAYLGSAETEASSATPLERAR
jgi:sulfate-transporting ATPase